MTGRGSQVDLRGGVEQGTRVLGLRMVEHAAGLPALHDAPVAQHRDHVGHLLHDAQVMGDEQARETVLALQPAQQVEHLGQVALVERVVGRCGIFLPFGLCP